MTEERINALLAFVGGLLVFIATLVPIMRAIFKRLSVAPNKEQIVSIGILCLQLLLWMSGAFTVIFSSFDGLGISLLSIAVVISLIMFVVKQSPPTRASIVTEVVIPVVYLAYMIIAVWVQELTRQVGFLIKQQEVEQDVGERRR